MIQSELRDQAIKQKNMRLVAMLGLLLVGMGIFAYALVPFYQLVCRRYGVGIVEQRPNPALLPVGAGQRTVNVSFLGMANEGTPASIAPLKTRVTVHVGETTEVNYRFTNLTAHPLDLQAVHSVTPPEADAQFHKLICFCFTKQSLKPHETKVLPVRFWVDPKLPERDHEVTLQYTLFALHPELSARARS